MKHTWSLLLSGPFKQYKNVIKELVKYSIRVASDQRQGHCRVDSISVRVDRVVSEWPVIRTSVNDISPAFSALYGALAPPPPPITLSLVTRLCPARRA